MNAPALRISNIVYGRSTREGGRVVYLLNDDGSASSYKIAEQIVLNRWKKRNLENHFFGGVRMSPNAWRAIGIRFSDYITNIEVLSEEDINSITEADRKTPQTYKAPNAKALKIIFSALGSDKVSQICKRHLSPERVDRYGTPDLFLWGINAKTQKIAFIRLVEVKKPKERISKDQVEEIEFLKSLNIPARVLRLIER
jgi:hypothetical protein